MWGSHKRSRSERRKESRELGACRIANEEGIGPLLQFHLKLSRSITAFSTSVNKQMEICESSSDIYVIINV
jgi:hypothetical protein